MDGFDFSPSAPRISREFISGPHYECLFCGRRNLPMVWEYDEDARELVAITCIDIDDCGAAQNARHGTSPGNEW